MREFVVIFARPVGVDSLATVLVILKSRPASQAGRFNLPGGKIEPNETPEQAAVRELKEETGLSPAIDKISVLGKIQGKEHRIYCVKVPVFYDFVNNPDLEEPVAWVDWSEIKIHDLLITNLKVIVPLMAAGISGWTLHTDLINDTTFILEFEKK